MRFLLALALVATRLTWADPFPIWRESWPGYSLSNGKMTVQGNRAFVLTDKGLSILETAGVRIGLIGTFPLSYRPQALVLDGDRAYLGGEKGLLVLDISNPGQPRLIAQPFSENVFGLVMHKGQLVFGWSEGGGASYMKYLDPARPGETWPETDNELWIGGSRSYDAIHSMGEHVAFTSNEQIKLVELSNPTSPRVLDPISRFGNGPYGASTIHGNRAYFVSSTLIGGQRPRHRLETIELSDPSPRSLASPQLPEVIWSERREFSTEDGVAIDLEVANNRAYVATNLGLLIYDISDPALPRLITQLPEVVGSVALDRERIFVLGLAGLMWFNPDLSLGGISDLPMPGLARLEQVGSAIFTEVSNRVYPYRLEGGAIQRVLAGGFPMSSFKPLRGSLACGIKKGSLEVMDLADPSQPLAVASLPLAGSRPVLASLHASETHVLGRSDFFGGNIMMYDLREPTRPRLIGTMRSEGFRSGLFPNGRLSVEQISNTSLLITDWSNPESPRQASEIKLAERGGIVDFRASEQYLLVVNRGTDRSRTSPEGVPPSLVVVDVADPANPKILGLRALISTPGQYFSLRVVGRRAYVSLLSQGFVVVDWADPTRPRTLASFPNVAAYDSLEHEGRIHVATGTEGLTIFEWGEARGGITGSETTGGHLLLRLEGTPGLEVSLERSRDMRLWESWKPYAGPSRVTFGREPILVKDELDIPNRHRFYRLTRP